VAARRDDRDGDRTVVCRAGESRVVLLMLVIAAPPESVKSTRMFVLLSLPKSSTSTVKSKSVPAPATFGKFRKPSARSVAASAGSAARARKARRQKTSRGQN